MNVTSDVINFRTSGQQSQTTQHYGNLRVDGSSSSAAALDVANNLTGTSSTRRGVRGAATATAGYGYGGYFSGGRCGAYGEAILSGSG